MPLFLLAAPAVMPGASPQAARSASPLPRAVSEHIPLHPAFPLQGPQPVPLAEPQGTALCPHMLLVSLHGVGCCAACRGGKRTRGSQVWNHRWGDCWLTPPELRRPQLCPLQTSLTNPPNLSEDLCVWLKPGAVTAKPWARCKRPR